MIVVLAAPVEESGQAVDHGANRKQIRGNVAAHRNRDAAARNGSDAFVAYARRPPMQKPTASEAKSAARIARPRSARRTLACGIVVERTACPVCRGLLVVKAGAVAGISWCSRSQSRRSPVEKPWRNRRAAELRESHRDIA